MVNVMINDGTAIMEVQGLHKLWAFKNRLEIPLRNIRAASQADPDITSGWWKGWRVPGTHIPGVIVAGTYYQDGRRIFWDVRHAERAIVIDLDDEEYNRLIIEVEDPAAVINTLNEAIAQGKREAA